MTLLRTGLVLGTSAAEAANCAGVPFIGAALVVLGELGRTCQQVQVHKVGTRSTVIHQAHLVYRHNVRIYCGKSPLF